MLHTKMFYQKFNKANEEQEDHSNKIAALRQGQKNIYVTNFEKYVIHLEILDRFCLGFHKVCKTLFEKYFFKGLYNTLLINCTLLGLNDRKKLYNKISINNIKRTMVVLIK